MSMQRQWLWLPIIAISTGMLSECLRPTLAWTPTNWGARRTLAIPDKYPLGNVTRAIWHQMETNGEAADFILYDNDFVGQTAELTPAGKDKLPEIAARMRSAPFPVLVERTMHNSDPELDQLRRRLIAQILIDMGNPDANQRTVVSQPYSNGITAREAVIDARRFRFSRGNGNGNNNNGGGAGGGGGF